MSKPATKTALTQDELIDHYCYICFAVDVMIRIRSLVGSRVRDDASIQVACRLTWDSTESLFRPGHQGFLGRDDEALRLALAADECLHPEDYQQAYSIVTETARRTQPRPDDDDLVMVFVDPQIGFADGNVIPSKRWVMRLRDRATMDELISISAFFLPRLETEYWGPNRLGVVA